MPRIIVLAERGHGSGHRVVMEGRLVSAHLESDHASAQLVERLGWAIVDADDLERADPAQPHHFHRLDSQDERRLGRGGVTVSITGSTHTSAFAEVHVEQIGQSATPAEVEEFIERQPISEEYRSVPWLRARKENAESGSRAHLGRPSAR